MSQRLRELFEANRDEFLRFERVESPKNPRPDLCAFLLLHELVPGTEDMIADAQQDEYFLSISVNKLDAVATDADIITLIRCGVRYHEEHECLALFS